MAQADGSYLANHSTWDLRIQDVAGSAEMGTHYTYEAMVFDFELR